MGRRTRTKKATTPVPVDATKHPSDTRTNIPTAELESFAAEAEQEPKKLLYPRDPSLDPQLVWKGKDEQDRQPLEVPAVPIYIQETIEPRALIEDLRAQSKGRREEQVAFFEPFEGMEFGDRVDFYQHEGKWTNRMILGDSLLVMASLAEKEGLKRQVQMIYVDPPYGIKFGSNWQVSTRKHDVRDGRAEDATRQPEQIRAFRDTWELGIHSYLGYLRDRLVVARDLLTETGSIFVQIGDENVQLVRGLLDEVFGSENFAGQINVAKTSGATSSVLPSVYDFLLWYAVDRTGVKYRELFQDRAPIENPLERYICVETRDGQIIDLSVAQKRGEQPIPEGRLLRLQQATSQGESPGDRLRPVTYAGREFYPPQRSPLERNSRGHAAGCRLGPGLRCR
jgi:adenine-specific DNA-methyltransferase